ncbi:MAG: GHKL domain-containing protein [Butyrivibrio sp.]|uniref:GHKL domain-containing protein n=1 Tax=Butyrivibrio sp. TaxID=28121 RepID=UPI001B1E3E30|nr:GHKL domain-containing protein [Butyrivibrio sp.]MBO6241302.1 GHKL domain-containing protein [Butyrivibrio sp.]
MSESLISSFTSVGYYLEILIAEFLFLKTFEKRNHFFLRFPALIIASIIIVFRVDLSSTSSTFIRFFMLLMIIGISICVYLFSFKGNSFSIISSCIGGVATQHIANKFTVLFSLTPLAKRLYSISYFYPIILEIAVFTAVYLAVYFLVAQNFHFEKNSIRLNVLSITIVITCIGVNRLIADHNVFNTYYEAASCIYAIICCALALAMQLYLYKWQEEKTESLVIKGLLSASEKQYEQWKAMVQFTNIQTHDLKHMLDRIERLASDNKLDIPDLSPIRDSIEGFSPLVKTGNDVLDVLLRNMSTLCKQQNIRFNCVSYTDSLGAYDSMSLYFLFANAIDNARAGADTVTDPDKRVIDVSLKKFGDSVTIHIWNYFEGEIVFEDRLPVRENSEGGHGFGVKSIKMLVDKFEGAMNAYAEENVFHLNIILPI